MNWGCVPTAGTRTYLATRSYRSPFGTLHPRIHEVIGRERAAARQERDAEMLKLKSEIAELRGKTDTLLALFQTKGSVVDLPRGGWKRDGAA